MGPKTPSLWSKVKVVGPGRNSGETKLIDLDIVVGRVVEFRLLLRRNPQNRGILRHRRDLVNPCIVPGAE